MRKSSSVLLILALVLVGCASQPELRFVPVPAPEIKNSGQAREMTCPKCGRCYPIKDMAYSVTAMFCGPEDPCCNTATYSFTCRTTGDRFSVSIGECDWIVWGEVKP